MPPAATTTEAAPCAVCGTTRGGMAANTHRPARVDTGKYGTPGRCCTACYRAILTRFHRTHPTPNPRSRP